MARGHSIDPEHWCEATDQEIEYLDKPADDEDEM